MRTPEAGDGALAALAGATGWLNAPPPTASALNGAWSWSASGPAPASTGSARSRTEHPDPGA
jgi:hypothetical protein